MLMPKRVKHRKVQRGRMKGKATRGNFISLWRLWNSSTRMWMDYKQPNRSCQNCYQ